jgi:hypothetical protein
MAVSFIYLITKGRNGFKGGIMASKMKTQISAKYNYGKRFKTSGRRNRKMATTRKGTRS